MRQRFELVDITQEALEKAADFWALLRQTGLRRPARSRSTPMRSSPGWPPPTASQGIWCWSRVRTSSIWPVPWNRRSAVGDDRFRASPVSIAGPSLRFADLLSVRRDPDEQSSGAWGSLDQRQPLLDRECRPLCRGRRGDAFTGRSTVTLRLSVRPGRSWGRRRASSERRRSRRTARRRPRFDTAASFSRIVGPEPPSASGLRRATAIVQPGRPGGRA